MVFKVSVTTGRYDEKSVFTLNMSLIDNKKQATDEVFTKLNTKDSENSASVIPEPEEFGNIEKIFLRIEDVDDKQHHIDVIYVERFSLGEEENSETGCIFPVQRILKCNTKYTFHVYDSLLPQLDDCLYQRNQEIAEERLKYELEVSFPNGPLMVKTLPKEEEDDYLTLKKWILSVIHKLLFYVGFTDLITRKVKKLNDYKKLHKFFPEPKCIRSCGTDMWFAKQRLQGINPVLIKICHNIPEKFAVKSEEVEPFLQDKTLEEAVDADRIFIIDLALLHELPEVGEEVWAPMSLFYLTDDKTLLPIAIQLKQEPGPENPVFLPSDPEFTWKAAKYFYSVSEGIHHETITHLSNVHIVLDVICISMRRIMSRSHPIYRLLNPHFWRLLGNNHYGLISLFKDGGIYDKAISGGNFAARALIVSSDVLEYYPYRDDGLLVYDAVETYVRKIVNNHYDKMSKLKNDSELRNWRLQLGRSQEHNGCGLIDLPGDEDDGFLCTEDIVQLCAAIIFTASAQHAAVNYPQYENYAHPPNHPLKLNAPPFTTKDAITEEDLVKLLPNNITTLRTMLFATVLSYMDGKPLGEFDTVHLYHPKDVQAAAEFREDLQRGTEIITERNREREVPYPWMATDCIKNSPNV
ncbi:Arachidonate 12-lipoxygenase, 12R-type [Nymphon striatum]|nr:Arachidonate 12-lipoxygenase, 12R-type [Nymphon striatum]